MSITLTRIDDRLIHGQVVIGWGVPLGVQLIVLVDDDVAANTWEQEIYRMAVPAGVAVDFVSLAEAVARLREWDSDARKVFLLAGSVETIAALVHGAPGVLRAVNVGGVHAGSGRRERLRYVYLTEDEAALLHRLEEDGVSVIAQDLPTSAPVRLRDLR